ncbi:MAG: hypothetical protein AAFU66_08490, partial [Pseudomonadota bacterium]
MTGNVGFLVIVPLLANLIHLLENDRSIPSILIDVLEVSDVQIPENLGRAYLAAILLLVAQLIVRVKPLIDPPPPETADEWKETSKGTSCYDETERQSTTGGQEAQSLFKKRHADAIEAADSEYLWVRITTSLLVISSFYLLASIVVSNAFV